MAGKKNHDFVVNHNRVMATTQALTELSHEDLVLYAHVGWAMGSMSPTQFAAVFLEETARIHDILRRVESRKSQLLDEWRSAPSRN